MADISQVNLPNDSNNPYNITDANVPHSSLVAASGGTDLSLVTTGEKYTWNNSTDTKVTQTMIDTTESGYFPVLLSNTGTSTSTETAGVKKTNWEKMSYAPLTNELVGLSGIVLTNPSYLNVLFITASAGSGNITLSDRNSNDTISLNGAQGAITANSLNGSAIGSSPEFTDNKVTQTNTTSNTDYRVLLSGTNDDTDRTEGANKSVKLQFTPAVNSGSTIAYKFKDGTRGNWLTDQVCGLLDIAGFSSKNIRLCGDGTVAAEKIICHSMFTYDISDQYTITKTSGNWKVTEIGAIRSGNVIHIRIAMSGNGSSVSAGSNGFVGTITAGALPALSIKLIAYYNNCPVMANIEPNGDITARVTATSVTVTTTGTLALTGTFITNN